MGEKHHLNMHESTYKYDRFARNARLLFLERDLATRRYYRRNGCRTEQNLAVVETIAPTIQDKYETQGEASPSPSAVMAMAEILTFPSRSWYEQDNDTFFAVLSGAQL